MTVALDSVVPWGRSLDEYTRMFALTPADLAAKIVDCGGGPASFNAELRRRSRRVVSCDPIYRFSPGEIAARIDETAPKILEATRQTIGNFVWTDFRSPEDLGRKRRAAMQEFLDDFPAGIAEGRYRVAELPSLPFADGEFDLALCSHFLFTYSNVFDLRFHIDSIFELCRVARQTRVFPLIPQFEAGHSPWVAGVIEELGREGYACEIERIPYEFQKGGNEMLRISRAGSANP